MMMIMMLSLPVTRREAGRRRAAAAGSARDSDSLARHVTFWLTEAAGQVTSRMPPWGLQVTVGCGHAGAAARTGRAMH